MGITPEILVGDVQVSPRLPLLQVYSFEEWALVSGNQRKSGLGKRQMFYNNAAMSNLGGTPQGQGYKHYYNLIYIYLLLSPSWFGLVLFEGDWLYLFLIFMIYFTFLPFGNYQLFLYMMVFFCFFCFLVFAV